MTAPGDQKMWGGRFERGPDASFYEFERSWSFDRRMLPQELALDRAWAGAIAAAGILTADEAKQIVAALDCNRTTRAHRSGVARRLESRRRSSFRRNRADRKTRPARREAAHRPQPQRNGGHRISNVCEGRRGASCSAAHRAAAASVCRSGRKESRHSDGRQHAYAARAAALAFPLAARAWRSFRARC